MNEDTYKQIIEAANSNDAFAQTILGMFYLDTASSQNIIDEGVKILCHSGDLKNCIWAKNALFFIRRSKGFNTPLSKHILVEDDALTQLKNYADSGNMWAMTAYGNLRYLGYSNAKNKDEGIEYLRKGAISGCLLANEYMVSYGIKPQHPNDTLLQSIKSTINRYIPIK